MDSKLLFIGLLGLMLFISGCITVDYEIVDNQIIAESEVFDLTITPATSHELLTHCHVIDVIPAYSEDIDIGGSFENNLDWVKGFMYYEDENIEVVESEECTGWSQEEYEYSCFNNQTQVNETCTGYNSVCDGYETTYENVTTNTFGWNEQSLNTFAREDEIYYMMEDQSIVADETNKFKFCYKAQNAGKWNFWSKRSQDDWDVDYILNIDPWWDNDYEWKRTLTLNNTEAIDKNNETVVISNISQYFGEYAQDDYDDVRIIFNYSDGSNGSTIDLTGGLEAYYELEDNATDLTGNGNDGTVNGPTFEPTCLIDGCYDFDAINDYIEIDGVLDTASAYSISAWFKTTEGDNVIFGKTTERCSDAGNTEGCTMISLGGSGQASFTARIGGSYVATVGGSSFNNNNWHHIVGVYNGTAIILYVDGQEIDSTAVSGTLNGNLPTYIGRRNGPSGDERFWNDLIDEVGIWHEALNATEIDALYNNSDGRAYDTLSEVMVGDVINESYTEVPYELFDGNKNIRFVTDIPASSTKDVEIYYGNSEATEANYSDCGLWAPCTPLWNYTGLIGWYAFDDGTALDYAGGASDGILYGDTDCSVAGEDEGFGMACEFDGTDDYIDTVNLDSTITNIKDWSISGWFKYDTDGGNYRNLFGWRKNTAPNEQVNILSDSNNKLYVGVVGSTGDVLSFTTTQDYSDNQWHHFALNYDEDVANDDLSLYIDNSFVDSDTGNLGDISYGNVFPIGYRGGSGGQYWDGTLDEVKIWSNVQSVFPQEPLYQTMGGEESIETVSISDVSITPTPTYSNSELNCSVTFTNSVTQETDVTFTWYKNDVNVDTYDTTISEVAGETDITQYTDTLVTETLTVGDSWVCNVYAVDSSTPLENDEDNSTAVTILNTAPTFDHLGINWTDYHSVNISIDINATDIDLDTISYYIVNTSTDLNTPLEINITTGLISYNPVVNETGQYNYTITASDGTDNTTQYLNITLLNRMPTIPDELLPIDNWTIFTDNVNLTCNGSTDADNDDIYYEFWGNATGDPQGVLQNTTSETYNWVNLTLGDTYIWKCRAHDTLNYSNFTVNRTVELINFTSCGGGDENVILNFTYQNEDNGTALSETFKANFQLESDDGDISEALFDLSDNTNHALCLDNNNQSITINTGMIEYVISSFDARNYYFYDATINQNDTSNIVLYSLAQDLASGISITVSDESGAGLEEHLIYVERYNVETNTYRLIAMGKTGDDGKDTIFLRGGTTSTGDVWYRFKVYYEGELLYTGLPQKITSSTLSLNIGLTDYIDHVNTIGDVEHTLTHDEETDIFTATFSTTTGLPRNFCMKVVEERPGKYFYDKYEECVNSASGALTYTHDNTSFVYHAYTYSYASSKDLLGSLHIEQLTNQLGETGVFITALLVMILVTVGAFSPVAAVLLGTLGIVASSIMGLITLAQATIAAIITLSLIIIIKIGRGGR